MLLAIMGVGMKAMVCQVAALLLASLFALSLRLAFCAC